MRLQLFAAAIAALILAGTTAADAQYAPWQQQGPAFSNNTVIDYDQYIGQDPDLFMRLQILRDNPVRSGGNN